LFYRSKISIIEIINLHLLHINYKFKPWKKLVLLLTIILTFSCQTEEINPIDSNNTNTRSVDCNGVGATVLINCGESFYLNDITGNSTWTPFDNGALSKSQFIDYAIEQVLLQNHRFNYYRNYKDNPIQVGQGQFEFKDYQNTLFDENFDYLNNNISSSIANSIKIDLACKLKSYIEENYPSYSTQNIYDLNVYGQTSLCGDDSISPPHKLIIDFKIGVAGGPISMP
jgi:hypothetical protein